MATIAMRCLRTIDLRSHKGSMSQKRTHLRNCYSRYRFGCWCKCSDRYVDIMLFANASSLFRSKSNWPLMPTRWCNSDAILANERLQHPHTIDNGLISSNRQEFYTIMMEPIISQKYRPYTNIGSFEQLHKCTCNHCAEYNNIFLRLSTVATRINQYALMQVPRTTWGHQHQSTWPRKLDGQVDVFNSLSLSLGQSVSAYI